MSRIVAVLTLALTVAAAHAEEHYARASGGPPSLTLGETRDTALVDHELTQRLALVESLRDDRHNALVMRNTGIVMTVLGSAASIAAAVLLSQCVGDDGCHGALLTGVGLLAVGPGSAIVGIPLWAVGQSRASRANKAMVSLSAMGARLTF